MEQASIELKCVHCQHTLRETAKFCDGCGMPVLSATPVVQRPMDREDIRLSIRLWDVYDDVSQKHRQAKRTAREIAVFFDKRIKLEENYANELIKLAQTCPIVEQETLSAAWHAVRVEHTKMGQLRLRFAERIGAGVHKQLDQMHSELKEERQTLQDQHDAVLKHIARSKASLKKANDSIDVARRELSAVQAKLHEYQTNKNVSANKLQKEKEKVSRAAKDLDQAQESHLTTQTEVFTNTNRYNQTVSGILEAFEESELNRLGRLQEILNEYLLATAECSRDAAPVISSAFDATCKIDAIKDVNDFVASAESGKVCPWASPRTKSPPPEGNPVTHAANGPSGETKNEKKEPNATPMHVDEKTIPPPPPDKPYQPVVVVAPVARTSTEIAEVTSQWTCTVCDTVNRKHGGFCEQCKSPQKVGRRDSVSALHTQPISPVIQSACATFPRRPMAPASPRRGSCRALDTEFRRVETC